MSLPRPAAAFLLAAGGWNWLIWPNFLRNIWQDERSWQDGPTAFLVVHAGLTGTSLAIGTGVAVIGWRSLRAARRRPLAEVRELSSAGRR